MNKKRMNLYMEEEDRRIARFLQARYGLDSESSVIRFLLRKAAREEGYVPRETGQPGQDRPTR